jgi:hypothetical protein
LKDVKSLKKAIIETVHELNRWMKQSESLDVIFSNPPPSALAQEAIEKLQKLDDELTELEKETKNDA